MNIVGVGVVKMSSVADDPVAMSCSQAVLEEFQSDRVGLTYNRPSDFVTCQVRCFPLFFPSCSVAVLWRLLNKQTHPPTHIHISTRTSSTCTTEHHGISEPWQQWDCQSSHKDDMSFFLVHSQFYCVGIYLLDNDTQLYCVEIHVVHTDALNDFVLISLFKHLIMFSL